MALPEKEGGVSALIRKHEKARTVGAERAYRNV